MYCILMAGMPASGKSTMAKAIAEKWIEQFIDYAIKRNIDEIFFLEHTHIFKECSNLYNEISKYNEYQKNWFQKKRFYFAVI